MKRYIFLLIINVFLPIVCTGLVAQEERTVNVKMTLKEVIDMAHMQSLASFRAKNMYLTQYWAFRSYKASRLPSLNLFSTPINYSQTVDDVYIEDKGWDKVYTDRVASNLGLNIKQNITLTGGVLKLNSTASGSKNYNTGDLVLGSKPLEVEFTQDLSGYNEFRWMSKIEPLRFEKAKKQFLVSMENMAIEATNRFFDVALSEINLVIAETNYSNADTLLRIGRGRFEIGTVTQDELLDLELTLLNAQMTLTQAKTGLRQSRTRLNSYLGLDKNINIECIIPDDMPGIKVDVNKALGLMQENNPDILSLEQDILEANMRVAETRASSGLEANISANVGFNKITDEFNKMYRSPFEDEKGIRVGLRMPILDWGERKGKIQMVKARRDEVEAAVKQERIDLEQQVITQIIEFNLQEQQVKIAAKADTIAQLGYDVTKQRFMIDKVDVIKLNMARNSLDNSKREYIGALMRFWTGYYNIRRITLYDFENEKSLIQELDHLIQK